MTITDSLETHSSDFIVNFSFKCHQDNIYQLNYGAANNRLLFFFLASRLENVKKTIILQLENML